MNRDRCISAKLGKISDITDFYIITCLSSHSPRYTYHYIILTNRSLLYGVIRLGLRKRYQLSFVCTDFPVYYMCEAVSYLHIHYHEDYTDNG